MLIGNKYYMTHNMTTISTADEYYHAVTNFNRDRARAELDALPKNLNPTGKTWRKHY